MLLLLFKPLNLWYFVTASIEKSYTFKLTPYLQNINKRSLKNNDVSILIRVSDISCYNNNKTLKISWLNIIDMYYLTHTIQTNVLVWSPSISSFKVQCVFFPSVASTFSKAQLTEDAHVAWFGSALLHHWSNYFPALGSLF